MPSTANIEPPDAGRAVASRYLKRERPLNALVAALAAAVFVAVYLATSLLPAVLVGAVLVVVARAPVLKPRGSVRLRADADPETVLDAFTGPTPPALALQWGVADEIRADDETATYHVSYLFGLRSELLTVRRWTETAPGGGQRVELTVTANDRPRATYSATIHPVEGGTDVEVAYTSDRRFGLRRLPQQVIARPYRNEALEAQGYTVVERDAHLLR